jgi:iron(II)-dependent oxidoreductase
MSASIAVRGLHSALLLQLQDARRRTDAVFSFLRPEALYERAIPERHRLVFYLGHLEAFDWNLFSTAYFCLPSFHPSFDKLFAFGIDPVSGNLPTDQSRDWPSEAEIRSYNAEVRSILDDRIAGADEAGPASRDSVPLNTLLHVAIEHRLMHAETLAYLLHELPFDRKLPRPDSHMEASAEFRPDKVAIPAGVATLGRQRGAQFGWDNEFDEHQQNVAAFTIDAFPVTNRQFLSFVRAGGYNDSSLWTPEAWKWLSSGSICHPHFWVPAPCDSKACYEPGGWSYRGMFAATPLPGDSPAWVSHAEASAYARWTGRRLPTEAEWHRAAFATDGGPERPYPWGNAPPSSEYGNFNFAEFTPHPVEAHPAGQSAFGVHDLVGNGWEWTSTLFQPFPGFAPYSFYPGYSADFFDGRHFVMKGGSPQTAACMLRRSFRNWFQPHYPYVYAKFRCVDA